MAKFKYVFQGHSGYIYGKPQMMTSQIAGMLNARNRRNGSIGAWVREDNLTPQERAKVHPESSLQPDARDTLPKSD